MTNQFSCEGYARGWFLVALSEELASGAVKPLRYFGKNLVLFRTESGTPIVLDAYCPHMGAHLAYGGKVKGDEIECPFHAWRFDGQGTCTDIPYAKKIPSRADTVCWPVRERNGMIFVWHGRDKSSPSWEIPEIPEFGNSSWTNWDHNVLEVKTHPHAIAENVADTGHFIPVHQTHVTAFENTYDHHMATQINSGIAYPLGGGEDRYTIRATYHGPGFQLSRMDGYLQSIIVNAHTPIDENTLHLRFAIMISRPKDDEKAAEFLAQYMKNLRDGFLQDIRIWEHKVFRERPVLCDGDGPIPRLRKWYRQFYEPVTQEA